MLAVALAGGLGAALRYAVDRRVPRPAGGGWPWGTLAVNVTGALWLGCLVGFGGAAEGPVVRILGTGFLGAYTTFSTWMLEALESLERGHARGAGLYVLGSIAAGLLAAGAGLALGRAVGGVVLGS